jgi:uncharacterized membrane-anchored protein YitT (DUF2179 family)
LLHRLFFAAGGLLVLLLFLDGSFPCGEKLVLMEAQVAELIALFPQKLGVVVDFRRVYLVFQLHFAGAAGFHLVLAGFDLSAQLGPAAALLGGVFVGVGVGLIVRQGGSSGGDDALALVIHKLTGWRLSRAYLFTDLTVLFASLSYIPFRRIAFSLVTVTVSSLLIDYIKEWQLKTNV